MARKRRTNKTQLNKRWQEINAALSELANLHGWPTGEDTTQVEGKLREELDVIEYQLI